MKEEVNKIKCSTRRSEVAKRRNKNRPLDFIDFEGNRTSNSGEKLPDIPAFPGERPRF